MNRILIINGKIIGGQTGGDDIPELMETRLDVLKQNALNAGFKEDEIEVKWVTDAEWAVIQTDTMKPTPEQIAATQEKQILKTGETSAFDAATTIEELKAAIKPLLGI